MRNRKGRLFFFCRRVTFRGDTTHASSKIAVHSSSGRRSLAPHLFQKRSKKRAVLYSVRPSSLAPIKDRLKWCCRCRFIDTTTTTSSKPRFVDEA